MSTKPATTAANELPPLKGRWPFCADATVVVEPSVGTELETDVVVSPGTVVVAPAVVTVEIVVVVEDGVSGTLDVVVVVDSPGGGGGGGELVLVVVSPAMVVDVVGPTVVVSGTLDVVVGVVGALHPAFKMAMPSDVQFLPPYTSPGPKSNGGMMSPHFVCLGMAGKKIGPLWPSWPLCRTLATSTLISTYGFE